MSEEKEAPLWCEWTLVIRLRANKIWTKDAIALVKKALQDNNIQVLDVKEKSEP